jgi:hypothetical protein
MFTISLSIPDREYVMLLQSIERFVDGKVGAKIEDATRLGAEMMATKIREEYANNHYSISPVTAMLKGHNRALVNTGRLMSSVKAIKIGTFKKGESQWVCTIPGATKPSHGYFGGSPTISMVDLARRLEKGWTVVMPQNGKEVNVPARPIWEPAYRKYSNSIIQAMIQSVFKYML